MTARPRHRRRPVSTPRPPVCASHPSSRLEARPGQGRRRPSRVFSLRQRSSPCRDRSTAAIETDLTGNASTWSAGRTISREVTTGGAMPVAVGAGPTGRSRCCCCSSGLLMPPCRSCARNAFSSATRSRMCAQGSHVCRFDPCPRNQCARLTRCRRRLGRLHIACSTDGTRSTT